MEISQVQRAAQLAAAQQSAKQRVDIHCVYLRDRASGDGNLDVAALQREVDIIGLWD